MQAYDYASVPLMMTSVLRHQQDFPEDFLSLMSRMVLLPVSGSLSNTVRRMVTFSGAIIAALFASATSY